MQPHYEFISDEDSAHAFLFIKRFLFLIKVNPIIGHEGTKLHEKHIKRSIIGTIISHQRRRVSQARYIALQIRDCFHRKKCGKKIKFCLHDLYVLKRYLTRLRENVEKHTYLPPT